MVNAVMLVRCVGWAVTTENEEEERERKYGPEDEPNISLQVADHSGECVQSRLLIFGAHTSIMTTLQQKLLHCDWWSS